MTAWERPEHLFYKRVIYVIIFKRSRVNKTYFKTHLKNLSVETITMLLTKLYPTALLFSPSQPPAQHCSIPPAASFLNLKAYNLGQLLTFSRPSLIYTKYLQAKENLYLMTTIITRNYWVLSSMKTFIKPVEHKNNLRNLASSWKHGYFPKLLFQLFIPLQYELQDYVF